MVKRNVLYEVAFEDYLRTKQVPYVAINEAKRPVVEGKKMKNFDFIVHSKKKNLLVEIKGKHFPYISSSGWKTYWENWIKKDDVEGLEYWQKKFGPNFRSIIVYCYYIRDVSDCSNFAVVHLFKGTNYGLVGIALEDFEKNAKPRSTKFDNAIYISRKVFPMLAKPLTDFL